jgi:hypothetical protein
MRSVLDEPHTRRRQANLVESLPALRRVYRCQCQRPVFFRNSQCLGCGAALGYEPHLGEVFPLTFGPQRNTWWLAGLCANRQDLYRRCANADSPAACNWLVKIDPATGAWPELCPCCRLNRTIPDLSVAENGVLWGRIEGAKRRVVSLLIALGLPVASRTGEDPERGLAFDLLRAPMVGPPLLTGHEDGVITLNIEEADNARRECIREAMRENYRTLVGHFRHEVGHYYWDRLIDNTPWIEGFRQLFGDERNCYDAALQMHYKEGPPPDWARRYVSSYASCHPWEDWAETWAHYLHMADTLGTAASVGLDRDTVDMQFEPFTADALYYSDDPGAERFLSFLNAWVELTAVLNELSRSMGQPDSYPFALPRTAVGKLQFIHMVVGSV